MKDERHGCVQSTLQNVFQHGSKRLHSDMIYTGGVATVLWLDDNLLLCVKFYMLHFTNFIFKCIFTIKALEYKLYEMKKCLQGIFFLFFFFSLMQE